MLLANHCTSLIVGIPDDFLNKLCPVHERFKSFISLNSVGDLKDFIVAFAK
jgi:hypothetical protein